MIPRAPQTAAAARYRPGSDSEERRTQRVVVRRDTEPNWLRNDPILQAGEFGFVIGAVNTGRQIKVGDGTRRWSELNWLMARGADGAPGPQGPPGPPGIGGVAIVATVEPPPPELVGTLWINPDENIGTGTGSCGPCYEAGMLPPGNLDLLWVDTGATTQQVNVLTVSTSQPTDTSVIWLDPEAPAVPDGQYPLVFGTVAPTPDSLWMETDLVSGQPGLVLSPVSPSDTTTVWIKP